MDSNDHVVLENNNSINSKETNPSKNYWNPFEMNTFLVIVTVQKTFEPVYRF